MLEYNVHAVDGIYFASKNSDGQLRQTRIVRIPLYTPVFNVASPCLVTPSPFGINDCKSKMATLRLLNIEYGGRRGGARASVHALQP